MSGRAGMLPPDRSASASDVVLGRLTGDQHGSAVPPTADKAKESSSGRYSAEDRRERTVVQRDHSGRFSDKSEDRAGGYRQSSPRRLSDDSGQPREVGTDRRLSDLQRDLEQDESLASKVGRLVIGAVVIILMSMSALVVGLILWKLIVWLK